MLLRVGDRFGFVRGRDVDPDAGRLADAVATADLTAARKILDIEFSLGTVGQSGWRITRSTLPFRIGDDLAPDLSTSEVTTAERDSSGAAIRRRWTVVSLDRSDHLLPL